jgi:hypothetical protein
MIIACFCGRFMVHPRISLFHGDPRRTAAGAASFKGKRPTRAVEWSTACVPSGSTRCRGFG